MPHSTVVYQYSMEQGGSGLGLALNLPALPRIALFISWIDSKLMDELPIENSGQGGYNAANL